jgi:hypothetical protein
MSFPLEAAAARGGLDARRPRLMGFLERIHARPAYRRAIEKRRGVRAAALGVGGDFLAQAHARANSSTARASLSRSSGVRMKVGVASTWKPLARRPSASASSAPSMTMPSISPRYSMAIARADTSRPSSRIIFRRGALQRAAADDGAHGDHRRAALAQPFAHAVHREDRLHRVVGIAGAQHHGLEVGGVQGVEHLSDKRASSAPPYWKPRTAGSHFRSTK